MSAWRPGVLAELARHGLVPGPDESAEDVKERLEDLYLIEVRALKQRQQAGEIPLSEYASHAARLRSGFELLGLPPEFWRV